MRHLLTLFAALTLAACGEADRPEAIDEADSVTVLDSDEAADADYLDPERDPEGDGLMGEPDGPEAVDSTNDDGGFTDPIESADQDADPDD